MSKCRALTVIFLVVVLPLLFSCGGGGSAGVVDNTSTTPKIYAEVISYPSSNSANSNIVSSTASARIVNPSTGTTITNAIVTVNDVLLRYDAASQEYKGLLTIDYGSVVNLNVTIGNNTFTASGNQFSSNPVILAPVANGNLELNSSNTISWTSGPIDYDVFYGLGIANTNDNNLIWPSDGFLQTLLTGTTSYQIPANSLSAGSRAVILGIARTKIITNGYQGSNLLISVINSIPVTVSNTPGLNWTNRSVNSPVLKGVTWTGSQFVAVGIEEIIYTQNGWYGAYTIFTSPDGATWTSRISALPDPYDLNAVTSSSTQIVAVGMNSIVTSSDGGVSWAKQNVNVRASLYAVTWSGQQYVAAGTTYTTVGGIQTSPDGITWTSQTLPIAAVLNGIVWSGNQFIAVGALGVILTSPDAITWTKRASPTIADLKAITYTGSMFVAVGQAGTILTSTDGITWTPQTSGTTHDFTGISYSGQYYLASDRFGDIYISTDGISWTFQRHLVDNGIFGITWSGSKFVTVGYVGAIYTSP